MRDLFSPSALRGQSPADVVVNAAAAGTGARSAAPLPDGVRIVELVHGSGARVHGIVNLSAPDGPAAVWAMYAPPVSVELLCHVPQPIARDRDDMLVAVLRVEPLEVSSGWLVNGIVVDADLLLQRTWTSSLMTARLGFAVQQVLPVDAFPGGALLDTGVPLYAAPGTPGWWSVIDHDGEANTPFQLVEGVVTDRHDDLGGDQLAWFDLDTALGVVRAYGDGSGDLPAVGARVAAVLVGFVVSLTDHIDDLQSPNPNPQLVSRLANSRWRGPLPQVDRAAPVPAVQWLQLGAPDMLPASLPTGLTKAALVAYLRGCPVALAARTLLPDRIDPAQPKIPLAYSTDGAFVWSAEVAAYVDRYDAGLPDAFLAHVARSGARPPAVPEERRLAVAAFIKAPDANR